jgi:hypothetical protein
MADAKNDVPAIAAVLCRNQSAIRARLKKLGVVVPKHDRHRVYSKDQIELIKLMHRNGHGGNSITRTLGVTPHSLRWKCQDLGIRLRKPRADDRLYVNLDAKTLVGLRAAADERNITPGGLVRQLVEQIVRDNIFSAVIDAPPVKVKAKTAPIPKLETSPPVEMPPLTPVIDIRLEPQRFALAVRLPQLNGFIGSKEITRVQQCPKM